MPDRTTMSQEKRIYLGKNGKVFGPYTKSEIQLLDQKGDLEKYSYIWNGEKETWIPIEAPPSHPEALHQNQDHHGIAWSEIEAIGHNFIHLISGKLDRVTETGCDFLSSEEDESPVLALNSKIVLNMMDPKHGKTLNVVTTLSHITKKGSFWVYRLQWDHLPTFG
jgi:hypothetical protein